MEPMRRAQYRVEVDESAGAQVVVKETGGGEHQGHLIDVSAAGAGVRFDGAAAPSLAVGQEVNLDFRGRPFAEPITLAARVLHRTEERGGVRRYGFQFLRPLLDADMPPALRSYFNRRQAVRVQPAPGERIAVMLSAGTGPKVEARLDDLSIMGAGVVLVTATEPHLAEATSVNLSIHLPGQRRPVEVVGAIRHRLLVGGRIRYGIAFDADATPRFEHQQEAINRWIARREMDSLRESA
jgi:c-di-GMP-binding flagellar brake protein YcgR